MALSLSERSVGVIPREHTAKGKRRVLVWRIAFHILFLSVAKEICTFLAASRKHQLLLCGVSVLARLHLKQKEILFHARKESL